jgi:hypothetical protein
LKIRPSLSLKISLLAFLNVSLLALVFFCLCGSSSGLTWIRFSSRQPAIEYSLPLDFSHSNSRKIPRADGLNSCHIMPRATLHRFISSRTTDDSWPDHLLRFRTAFDLRSYGAIIIGDPTRSDSASRLCSGLHRSL